MLVSRRGIVIKTFMIKGKCLSQEMLQAIATPLQYFSKKSMIKARCLIHGLWDRIPTPLYRSGKPVIRERCLIHGLFEGIPNFHIVLESLWLRRDALYTDSLRGFRTSQISLPNDHYCGKVSYLWTVRKSSEPSGYRSQKPTIKGSCLNHGLCVLCF